MFFGAIIWYIPPSKTLKRTTVYRGCSPMKFFHFPYVLSACTANSPLNKLNVG